MTPPLTPEEARAAAEKIDRTADRTRHFADPIAATLRAYADQAERLKEIEGAVGEWIAAQDAWPATVATAKATREALDRLEAADARLRSHLETNDGN